MSTSAEPHSLLNCTVKELADYSISGAASLPSAYFNHCPAVAEAEPVVNEEIPTIDVSLLKNGTPEERSRVILDIGRACEEWGCFNVVNHGISESLQTAMMEAFTKFFNLTEEEKKYYTKTNLYEPVCHGTSSNLMGMDVRFWRDFLRVVVHPVFHYPDKPRDFRAISDEYAHKTREIYNELLRAIWESLDLDVSFMEESLELKSSRQTLVGNLYPPCPQPELVLGLPPHSDPCLVTLLMQNKGFNGLQVLHNGKWIVIQLLPRSLLYLTGDIIEIVSNGRYKSIVHRAMVSSESTRISVATQVTPPIENVTFAPAPKLLERSNCSTIFRGITFKEFFALKFQHKSMNSIMDFIKV
ncbi:flavanone 3-dioxygenase 2 [Dendrobium catenatum]|uniref:flavanone 3-dioxygenase 2 n=1 Tax=Dendrobium catenatum TaxID=906689 RepID=UPI0010A080E1|nr:flavanone 3-dioxygenase 2 [Dendrobium catenatum]